MSILNRLFRHKEETEDGRPEDWEEDEVWVRDASGRLVRLEVPDAKGEDERAPDA